MVETNIVKHVPAFLVWGRILELKVKSKLLFISENNTKRGKIVLEVEAALGSNDTRMLIGLGPRESDVQQGGVC